jgi:hypothetical protein
MYSLFLLREIDSIRTLISNGAAEPAFETVSALA